MHDGLSGCMLQKLIPSEYIWCASCLVFVFGWLDHPLQKPVERSGKRGKWEGARAWGRAYPWACSASGLGAPSGIRHSFSQKEGGFLEIGKNTSRRGGERKGLCVLQTVAGRWECLSCLLSSHLIKKGPMLPSTDNYIPVYRAVWDKYGAKSKLSRKKKQ